MAGLRAKATRPYRLGGYRKIGMGRYKPRITVRMVGEPKAVGITFEDGQF